MTTEVISPANLAGLPIMKVKEQEPFFNLLLYGEWGVGKTRLAGSADAVAGMRKVLFVDIEGGTLTLRNCYPDVDVLRVKTWDDMQNVYNELFATNCGGYNTIVIDSLTEIQKFNMNDIMRQVIENDSERDPDIPALRDWGKNIEQIRRFVRAFRDLPCNTIFTALVKSEKDNKTGVVTKKPSLSGKLGDEVAGFLDIVLFMYMKEVDGEQKRLLLSTSTESIHAKDRSNKLPGVVEEPTMQTLHDYILGGNK